MSTSSEPDDSDDEFESADEGETIPTPLVKPIHPLIKESQVSITSLPPVTTGWNDWNTEDQPSIKTSMKTTHPILPQQDSASSLSSSPSKTADSSSRNESDEESSEEQRSQRKQADSKFVNEENSINAQISRRDDEFSSAIVTKHHVKDVHHALDRLAAQSLTRTPNWHSPWSHFGSFLSNAKQSVSTLKNTVSEGFSAAIESVEAGLDAPDPQQLAEMNRIAFKIKGETSESDDEPEASTIQQSKADLVTNQDGWLNALSLQKLTTTGMKVVSGSLDVLETVGKKTFDGINEADPDLQGRRRLLNKPNRSTLSEIIRETQHEKESKVIATKSEAAGFFQLFEKHRGLSHFEALEFLSNQSFTTLQSMTHGNEKVLEQISTYFQVNDDELALNSLAINDESESEIASLNILSKKFTAYQTQLRSTVSVDKLLEVYESAHEFLKDWQWTDTELDQGTLSEQAIDCLARLCASIIEYYLKTAELFRAGCQSLTSFAIDIELLAIYQKQQHDFAKMLAGIPTLFAKYMKQASNGSSTDGQDRCDEKLKQKLLSQIFIRSSNSQTYASHAYILLKPIVSQSILYHTSTTR